VVLAPSLCRLCTILISALEASSLGGSYGPGCNEIYHSLLFMDDTTITVKAIANSSTVAASQALQCSVTEPTAGDLGLIGFGLRSERWVWWLPQLPGGSDDWLHPLAPWPSGRPGGRPGGGKRRARLRGLLFKTGHYSQLQPRRLPSVSRPCTEGGKEQGSGWLAGGRPAGRASSWEQEQGRAWRRAARGGGGAARMHVFIYDI
jgi:hypothetical protein